MRADLDADLPRGFAAYLNAKRTELLARLGEPPARDRRPSEDESVDPRALLALARAHRFGGHVNVVQELLERARGLAVSLRMSSLVGEIDLELSPDGELEPETLAALAPLAREDYRVGRLLEDRGAFDAQAAQSLAESLERRGRDDRAARLWLALASRAPETVPDAFERAEAALSRVTAGFSEERAVALRATLLGRPDPEPTDLRPRPRTEGDDPLDTMAIQELQRINSLLLESGDLHTLFQSVVEGAVDLTGAERGFLVLEEDGELHFDLALDSARGGIARPELETSRTLVQRALDEGRPLRLSNAADDPASADKASVVSLELRSILCVRRVGDDDVLLPYSSVCHRQETAIDDDEGFVVARFQRGQHVVPNAAVDDHVVEDDLPLAQVPAAHRQALERHDGVAVPVPRVPCIAGESRRKRPLFVAPVELPQACNHE